MNFSATSPLGRQKPAIQNGIEHAITGNVAITTSDGAKLSSKELRWTAKDELLAAVGDATAVKDDMKASGDRIESTDGFNKIKIIGKAHLVKGGTSE